MRDLYDDERIQTPYDKCLERNPDVLTVDEAFSIYEDMYKCILECSAEEKKEFFDDFLSKAIQYAHLRANWELMDRETRMNEDEGRILLHNSVITSINVLKRLCDIDNIDTSWRDKLGSEREGTERKRIGDFACFMAYITGVRNR